MFNLKKWLRFQKRWHFWLCHTTAELRIYVISIYLSMQLHSVSFGFSVRKIISLLISSLTCAIPLLLLIALTLRMQKALFQTIRTSLRQLCTLGPPFWFVPEVLLKQARFARKDPFHRSRRTCQRRKPRVHKLGEARELLPAVFMTDVIGSHKRRPLTCVGWREMKQNDSFRDVHMRMCTFYNEPLGAMLGIIQTRTMQA